MEDKIREAIKALEDKVSLETAMEVDSHKAEIESKAREAYENAKREEVEKIHDKCYAKYEPAIRVLNDIVAQCEEVETKPSEVVPEVKPEVNSAFPTEGE